MLSSSQTHRIDILTLDKLKKFTQQTKEIDYASYCIHGNDVDLHSLSQFIFAVANHNKSITHVLVIHVVNNLQFSVSSLGIFRRVEWSSQLFDRHLSLQLMIVCRAVSTESSQPAKQENKSLPNRPICTMSNGIKIFITSWYLPIGMSDVVQLKLRHRI